MQNAIPILLNYNIDPLHGFLPGEDPLKKFTNPLNALDQISANLPTLLMAGKLHSAISELQLPNFQEIEDTHQLQRAMLLLSVLGNAYVWGGKEPIKIIPRNISVPWQQVAEKLDRPMIVAHASMVLNNWRRLDKNKPLALDNLDTLQTFLGGMDEKWFYLVTVMVEAKGAPALPAIVNAQQAAANNSIDGLAENLPVIVTAVKEMQAMLEHMPEKCDPYIFYHRVRPFLRGWEEPGIIYEGVNEVPQKLFGGSAAQSSLLQSIDAGLGITHPAEETNNFLLEMRNYMPPKHRQFIEAIETGPSIRQFVSLKLKEYPKLADLYNRCIQAVEQFRKKHIEITVEYIFRQATDVTEAKGTGGTAFMTFLSKAKKETKAASF